MKKTRKFYRGLLIVVICLSLNLFHTNRIVKGAEPTEEVIRMMPLGDSITDGFIRQTQGGYRDTLCNLLEKNQYDTMVDFVGSLSKGTGYDTDHEGHSGWAIQPIAKEQNLAEGTARRGLKTEIANWLNTYQPQAVMLQIGTNDILSLYDLEHIGERLEGLVDTILQELPEKGMLFLSTITCMDANDNTYIKEGKYTVASMDAHVNEYNTVIKELVETKQKAGAQNITLVDMHSVLDKSDLYDGVHPNVEGYAKMGEHWYEVLREYIDSLMGPAPLDTVEWDMDLVNMKEKESLDLMMTVKDTEGTLLEEGQYQIEYIIDDEDIVQVRDGKLHALKAGIAQVIAKVTYLGETAESEMLMVIVESIAEPEPKPEPKPKVVKVGNIRFRGTSKKTLDLKKTAVPSIEVLPANATNPVLMYTSSNPKVATVDKKSGLIRAVSPGIANIQVTTTDGSNLSVIYKVEVKPAKVTSLKVKSKKSGQVTVTWKRLKNATGYQVQWSVKNKKQGFTKKQMIKKNRTIKFHKKMKPGKNVYFRVRAYKQDGSKKIYGNFSKVQGVKIKK